MSKKEKPRILTSFKDMRPAREPSQRLPRKKVPEYYMPSNYGTEGNDHINVSLSSNTRLGRVLAPACTHSVNIPGLGQFTSVMSFVYWLKADGRNEMYRHLDLAAIRSMSGEMKKVKLENEQAVLLYATWLKIKSRDDLLKDIKKLDDLTLLSYSINRKTNIRIVTPEVEKIIPVMNEVISAVKEKRQPNYGLFLPEGVTIQDVLNIGVVKEAKVEDEPSEQEPETKAKKRKKKKKVTPEERRVRDVKLFNFFNKKLKKLTPIQFNEHVVITPNVSDVYAAVKFLNGSFDKAFLSHNTVVVYAKTMDLVMPTDEEVCNAVKVAIEGLLIEPELNSIRRLARTYPTSNPVLYDSDVVTKEVDGGVAFDANGKTYTVGFDKAADESNPSEEAVIESGKVLFANEQQASDVKEAMKTLTEDPVEAVEQRVVEIESTETGIVVTCEDVHLKAEDEPEGVYGEQVSLVDEVTAVPTSELKDGQDTVEADIGVEVKDTPESNCVEVDVTK